MGLTILAFIALPGFVALFLSALRRGEGLPGRLIVAGIGLVLSAYALLQGLVFILTGPSFPPSQALALERISGALIVATHFLLLLFAFEFPTPLPQALRRFATMVSAIVVLLVVYDATSTYDYIVSVYRPWTTIFRIEGKFYGLFVAGDALVAALASAIFGIRALASKSRVHRQKAAVVAVLVAAGAALIFISTGLLSAGEAKRPSFVFAPAGALLIAGGVGYSFRLSRLFDLRAIGRTASAYGVLLGAVGIPAGLVVAGLAALSRWGVTAVAVVGAIGAFVGATFLAQAFSRRFLGRLSGRSDYRQQLESDLARIDLSRGRDAVLDDVYARLAKDLDFKDFCVLIDDDQGYMRTVYAPTAGRATIERGTKVSELLERSGSSVILKTEAETDAAFGDARAELLELFEALKAEALIVILEGRRAIALFAFGARSTGAEYTAYDYDTFRAIYGKLFVIAYYLKNIARESIMTTVDREIALSDQIIRFALEKVDKVEHPGADAHWLSRPARSLGGDFIDFVRISKERWFFVIGDVSGKGLSASMNMLILKSMIRTFLRVERDFVGLVARVNSFIKENLPKGTFFAGIFGYLDLSKNAFYYINCGIPTVLMFAPSFDTFIEVQGDGKILGFAKDIAPFIKPRKLALAPGSILVATTDGILDCENLRGERFGKDRLRRAVHDRLALSAAEITTGAVEDMMDFTDGRQEDDITLFVMKLRSEK
jgi:hypothetical protein